MTGRGVTNPDRSHTRLSLVVAAFATVLGVRALVFHWEVSRNAAFAPPWSNQVADAFLPALLWCAVGPAIAWVTLRAPAGRTPLRRFFVVHLLVGLLTAGSIDLSLSLFDSNLTRVPVISKVIPAAPGTAGGFDAAPSPEVLRQLEERMKEQAGSDAPQVRYAGLISAFLTYVIVITGLNALLYHELAKQRSARSARLRAELAQSQLRLLRNQLEPHFLFNALNGARTLMERDVAAAKLMLGGLSSLLRSSLRTLEQPLVSLERELECVEQFLSIERQRFGDRLSFRIEADEQTLAALVPPFSLQPLIENSLRHGVGTLAAGGTVTIRASRLASHIVLEVEDDGPGLPAGSGPAQEGIGLRNTRERLLHLYGDQGTLETESPDHGGFLTRLRIPWNQNPSTPEERPS